MTSPTKIEIKEDCDSCEANLDAYFPFPFIGYPTLPLFPFVFFIGVIVDLLNRVGFNMSCLTTTLDAMSYSQLCHLPRNFCHYQCGKCL